MTGSAAPRIALYLPTEFFALAKLRLSLDVPEALTNPHGIPRLDDPDLTVMAAIAGCENSPDSGGSPCPMQPPSLPTLLAD